MATPPDQPFDEADVIVGVTVVREDLRQLLMAARVHQIDEEMKGLPPNSRLQLAMDRIAATATDAEWQPKRNTD